MFTEKATLVLSLHCFQPQNGSLRMNKSNFPAKQQRQNQFSKPIYSGPNAISLCVSPFPVGAVPNILPGTNLLVSLLSTMCGEVDSGRYYCHTLDILGTLTIHVSIFTDNSNVDICNNGVNLHLLSHISILLPINSQKNFCLRRTDLSPT